MARARSSSIALRSIFRIGSSRASILAAWGEFSALGFPDLVDGALGAFCATHPLDLKTGKGTLSREKS
jgi:hypothetical protein